MNTLLKEHLKQSFGSDATYPQVSIGAKHLGNMHDTLHYMRRNELIH